MNRPCNRVATCLVVAAALSAMACGRQAETPIAGADDRLPADGSASGPSPDALKTKAITRAEWTRFASERLKPACDARSGAGQPDTVALKGAGDVVATWMEFIKKPKSGPKTDDGKKLGGGVEPTRVVHTVGMTCSATKNTMEVNGTQYPFDVAWVVSGQGSAPAISGGVGAGYFAMFEAISLKEKKIVFVKVYVPSDGNDDTDDTVIISNLNSYLPEKAEDPIVRATGEKVAPVFETLVFDKDATKGFAYQVPRNVALGRARYLAVGKFEVVD